ncbi:sigma-70 family RNA polymerase sigma factor [Roseisolibacter sp. H3M3-2]|uniref:RNA polymerase sigma factor n=1 Tax=Roseisolibacter sp. H3M3-2 TaxID=3031323 RepID=UPI0023DBA767|nr:sigma-70 family RNA polymerase sigma factor [Roseisolibacter sp. H3M3-2]MDF1505726.1 sigma-70 family RNA polymerase sigma factor [Roseisolibacter sp. H3M3-2]
METDAQLVRRAVDGDERAMRLLWSRHAAHVDAVVRRLVGDPDQAADVAQEVWIQIFRALPTWRGDSQFGTWAHRIAVNRTLNALRRVRRVGKHEASLDEALDADEGRTVAGAGAVRAAVAASAVEPEGERALLAASIAEATRQLAPGARQVFLLHDVEGYTHEEIAESLGITAGGSKSQLFKARAKLRRLLSHLVDGVAGPPSGNAASGQGGAERALTISGSHRSPTSLSARVPFRPAHAAPRS